jgi:hypothetical protein
LVSIADCFVEAISDYREDVVICERSEHGRCGEVLSPENARDVETSFSFTCSMVLVVPISSVFVTIELICDIKRENLNIVEFGHQVNIERDLSFKIVFIIADFIILICFQITPKLTPISTL